MIASIKNLFSFLAEMIDPILFWITFPCTMLGISKWWAILYMGAILFIIWKQPFKRGR